MIGLKINVNCELNKIEVKEPLHISIREELGGYLEIVRPRRLTAPYCMIVDEEGLLKDLPLNPIGCYLYETDKHMQPIVGDVIIMREVSTFEGISLASLDEGDMQNLDDIIKPFIEEFKLYKQQEEVDR